LNRRRLTALIAAASAVAMMLPAAPAGAAPTAQKSGEELVTIVTTGKLKIKSAMVVQYTCGADCSLVASAEFVIPGPNTTAPDATGVFSAGALVEDQLTPNKALRSFMKKNIKKSKLRIEVTATNVLTGEVDVDSNTFKLKK
jgi:hypothetical protein